MLGISVLKFNSAAVVSLYKLYRDDYTCLRILCISTLCISCISINKKEKVRVYKEETCFYVASDTKLFVTCFLQRSFSQLSFFA